VENGTGRILRVEWFYDSEPRDPALAVRPQLIVDFELNKAWASWCDCRRSQIADYDDQLKIAE
jgi:hypothetical protein